MLFQTLSKFKEQIEPWWMLMFQCVHFPPERLVLWQLGLDRYLKLDFCFVKLARLDKTSFLCECLASSVSFCFISKETLRWNNCFLWGTLMKSVIWCFSSKWSKESISKDCGEYSLSLSPWFGFFFPPTGLDVVMDVTSVFANFLVTMFTSWICWQKPSRSWYRK